MACIGGIAANPLHGRAKRTHRGYEESGASLRRVENAGDSIAAGEAVAIASGNGTSKPTGFLNTTPVTTTDDVSPLRSAEALMYVPGLSGSPDALDADLIIDLATATLKEMYLVGEGVAWVCHPTALSQIHQLKEGSGRYIWVESLVPGVPGTLLGYPVYTSDAMPTVASNAFPIAAHSGVL